MELISKELLAFIRTKEGFRAKAYQDGKGCSIGYGHYQANTSPSKVTTITVEEADKLLEKDIKTIIRSILKAYPDFIFLDQGKRDALTSLIYNWGLNNFFKSKLFYNLKKDRYKEAAYEFLDINKCNGKILRGLTKRRQEEADIFLCGW